MRNSIFHLTQHFQRRRAFATLTARSLRQGRTHGCPTAPLHPPAHRLAAGVSDQQGHIGRYDEAVIVVPVSITAFSFLRQAYGLGQVGTLQGLPYKLRGKLASGPLGTVRFTDEGKLDLPKGTTW